MELTLMDKITSTSNYLGEEYPGWYIAYSGMEDEPMDECNMVAFIQRLTGEGFKSGIDFQQACLGNFCGPASIFLLVKGEDIEETTKEVRQELRAYPVLDEDLASEMGVFDFEEEEVGE